MEREVDKLNPWAVEGVFIGSTENQSQYLVWVRERKEVTAMIPIFIEDGDQQRVPEQPSYSYIFAYRDHDTYVYHKNSPGSNFVLACVNLPSLFPFIIKS